MNEPAKAYRILTVSGPDAEGTHIYIGCEDEAYRIAAWAVEKGPFDIAIVSTEPVNYVQRTVEEAQRAQDIVRSYADWASKVIEDGSGTINPIVH